LAILAGSSGLALDFGEKSAPLYWVELWALLAYPLYLVAVKGGRTPAMRTFYVLAAVGLLWEALAIPRSSDPLRGARVIPFHMAGLAVYCFAVSLRLSRPRAAVAVRVLMLSSLLLLAFSATSFLAAGGLEEAASARAIESAVGRSNALATLFGMVGGFVAPNNYTFVDSLILVSILLLGGIGNAWGVAVATIIVVVVPEKLQTIQEYRFLLYASLVIIVLLFRPEGLLPRPVRRYFAGWRP